MNSGHIQRGIIFIGVCLLIALVLAFKTVSSNGSTSGNDSAAAGDNTISSPAIVAGQGDAVGEDLTAPVTGASAATTDSPEAVLAAARTDNLLAAQSIGSAWQALPPDVRARLLPAQRAWIKAKDAACQTESASVQSGPVDAEIRRLQCEKRVTDERLNWLQQYSSTPTTAEQPGQSGDEQANTIQL
jgi:hypothetical protein